MKLLWYLSCLLTSSCFSLVDIMTIETIILTKTEETATLPYSNTNFQCKTTESTKNINYHACKKSSLEFLRPKYSRSKTITLHYIVL